MASPFVEDGRDGRVQQSSAEFGRVQQSPADAQVPKIKALGSRLSFSGTSTSVGIHLSVQLTGRKSDDIVHR